MRTPPSPCSTRPNRETTSLPLPSRCDRRRAGAAFAVVLMLLLSACGGGESSSTPSVAPESVAEPLAVADIRLGLAVQSLERTFFTGMVTGATDQAASHGLTLEVADGLDSHETQVTQVEEMLDRIDALLLSPVDSAQSEAIVDRARERGVLVIAVANQVGSVEDHGPQHVDPDVVALVTNDDVSMGRRAGALAAVLDLEQPIDIAVLSGARGTANVAMRLSGFEKELQELGVDYRVVSDIDGAWTPDGGREACESFRDLSPDLVFSMSDAMTSGCVDAMDEETPIVSIGGNQAGAELLATGRITGSVCQKPGDMGALAVDVAVRALTEGATSQGLQFYETPVVTAENPQACVPQW